MNFTDWATIFENISKIAGGLAVIWAVLRWVIKPTIKIVKFHTQGIEKILEQLQPNGGGSICDAINEIRESVYKIEKLQRARMSFEDRGFFECDNHGKCNFVNRKYLQIVGASDPKEVLNLGWKNFLAADNRKMIIDLWNECVKEKRDFKSEVKYLTPDGDIVLTNVEAFVQLDKHGKLIGFVGCVTELED